MLTFQGYLLEETRKSLQEALVDVAADKMFEVVCLARHKVSRGNPPHALRKAGYH
jgi:hypothetical protein